MERLYFEVPGIGRKEDAVDYIREFHEYRSEINGTGGLDRFTDNYEGWLEKLEQDYTRIPNEEKVPARTFFLVRDTDRRIVGMINIRLCLNERLSRYGGHMGYSIRPTERGKGYNKINLYLGLKVCGAHGIDKVFMDADLDNPASWKTMEALGGIRIREYYDDVYAHCTVVDYNIDVPKALREHPEYEKMTACPAPAEQAMDIELLTLPEVREIYRTRMKHDFPGNELKELAMIEKVFREGRYLCYGAREGNDILAYAFFVLAEELYMLDYFAVKKERRGSGIGSRFLKELNSRCFREAACVLVEVDDPSFAENGKEKATRERQLAFYLGNGLRDTGARARTFGADFLILEFPKGEPHSRAEAGEFYSRIYRSLLPERIYEQMVMIS